LSKRLLKVLLILCFCIGLTTAVFSQIGRQTGSVSGTITDTEGNILPGVTVTAASDALMGTKTYVSTETGAFRFPALPPGHYSITFEMPGFKTVTREEVIVRVGMTVTINLQMEMTTIEEEVTVTAASPVVDVQQTKIAVIMDKELLKNIPMARDLYDIVNSAPGAVTENQTYRRTSSIHGGTVRGNTYAFDGVNMNDPVVMYPLTNINFDVMDEVEMVTAGHPASVGYTDGGYINIVTRSGGNRLSGGATIYYTNDGLAQHLWTDEQISALGVAKPGVDKTWIDGSITLGGPVIADKVWFFSNLRYINQEMSTNFIPVQLNFTQFSGWLDKDYLTRSFGAYDWTHEEKMGFIKLTGQLTSNIKVMGMFNYVDRYRPMYEQPAARTAFQRTRVWDHEKDYTGNGVLSYILDQNTFFDLRVGYVHRWFPIPLQDEAKGLPLIYNEGALYTYITTARFNETYLRKRFQVGAYFNRFQDNFLGGNHEFKGGVEFEDAYGDWDWWRGDNLYSYWYKGDPYYWGGNVMDVGFYICSDAEGKSKIQDKARRIGAYIQDSATFGERLTINAGIRFDRSWGFKPAVSKGAGGNPLSVWVGETVLLPEFGVNPFAQMDSEEWKDIMIWNSFSPRLGLTFDVFGDGRTALKASFSRYTEYLMLQYFSTLHPFYPRSFWFQTTDNNGDGWPDMGDTFDHYGSSPALMDPDYSKKQIDPDTKSPTNDEFTAGIWHELFKNFSVGFNVIYKNKKNIVENVLNDPETGTKWYTGDMSQWWKPVTTVVPGIDEYEDTEVTYYLPTTDHPNFFYLFTNVPELKRKYLALEFIFNKRMANGWQFSGSIVYSKMTGTIGGEYGSSWGWSGAANNANYFVNRDGRLDFDRPLQIKLMGTAQLPLRIFLSAFYRHTSGRPWEIDVNIRTDRSWMDANNLDRTYYSQTVNLEPEGSRRDRTEDYLDIRLEKEFRLGDFGTLGAYVDAINVLGWSTTNVGRDPISRWYPSATDPMNPNAGSYTKPSTYQTVSSVEGVITIKFSLRFSF
jgi:hypothetical protein